MQPPPTPPTHEQNKEKMRDDDFKINVQVIIQKYFPNIQMWDRYTLANSLLELAKEREKEANEEANL